MKLLIFLMLFLSQSVSLFAQSFVAGEGRFDSEEDDSLAFVKNQLKYSATRDVLSKELNQMGLNSDQFWAAFDQRFEQTFEPIKKELIEKKPKDSTPDQNKQFESNLRKRKLVEKLSFGGLDKLVPTYAIKKMTRSPQNPNSRYMKLEGKVDRVGLNKLYFSYVGNKSDRNIEKIYLSLNLTLENSVWADLGVQDQFQITKVVNEHWIKWFEKKNDTSIKEVVIVNEEIDRDLNRQSDIVNSQSEMVSKYANAIWITMNVFIKKSDENLFLKTRKLEYWGDFVARDLGNNKIIAFEDFAVEKFEYNFEDSHRLSSSIASYLYRLPLNSFGSAIQESKNIDGSKKLKSLEVVGYDNTWNISLLKTLLEEKGITIHLKLREQALSKDIVNLQMEYSGDEERLGQLILSLNNASLKSGKIVQFPNRENPFRMNLRATAGEAQKM